MLLAAFRISPWTGSVPSRRASIWPFGKTRSTTPPSGTYSGECFVGCGAWWWSRLIEEKNSLRCPLRGLKGFFFRDADLSFFIVYFIWRSEGFEAFLPIMGVFCRRPRRFIMVVVVVVIVIIGGSCRRILVASVRIKPRSQERPPAQPTVLKGKEETEITGIGSSEGSLCATSECILGCAERAHPKQSYAPSDTFAVCSPL